MRVFRPHLEKSASALQRFAVQGALCGAGFVTLHFDKAEAFALAGENVTGEVEGTYCSEFREQLTNELFVGFRGQVAYEEFENGVLPGDAGNLDLQKETPARGGGLVSTVPMELRQRLRAWPAGPSGRLPG